MKLCFKRGQYLGAKLTGFVYDETYNATVFGLVVWSYGLFLVIPYDDNDPD